MNDSCPICLDDFKEGEIKILSCNHKIHNQCYFNIVKRKNLFISCPICREINKNIKKVTINPDQNIIYLISNINKNGTMKRCICKTKLGKRCKNRSTLLNYGKCNRHHPNALKDIHTPIMEKYIYLILSQRNSWLSKVYLFDIGKKLVLKYFDDISGVEDILLKYYEFFSIILEDGDIFIKEYEKLYEYYGLDIPERNWIKNCKEKYILY